MWMKVDDGLHAHRKTRAVIKSHETKRRDAAPMGIWVLAGSWAAQNGTDGWVPEDELDRWDEDWEALVARLVRAGYWWPQQRDNETGYGFNDWHDYNDPADLASKSGTYGNHVRWHVNEKRVETDCEHCPKEPDDRGDIAPESGGDRGAISGGDSRFTSGAIALPEPDPTRTRPDPEPQGAGKPAPKRGRKPETKLAAAWRPTAEHLERALASGLIIGREVDKFRAHAAERDRRAVNWNAAFTRWLINAEGYAERDRPAPPSVRNLPHARDIELPPDGLTPEEYSTWERESRARRQAR